MDLIYIFLDTKPKDSLTLKGELHKYLIKVRRHKEGDEIFFRDRDDIEFLHKYKIVSVDSRTLYIELISSKKEIVSAKKELHIAWCIIDSKSIEKVLPSLNEIGVSRISFISCDRTQKNFKIDLKRFHRILEASMQQCGRSTYIKFDMFKNIKEFIKEFPDTKVFDFTQKTLDDYGDIKRVLIGCEGGFSDSEKKLLESCDVFRLDTPLVLRSESAVMAVASKIIL